MFSPTRSTKRYCSKSCRLRAFRERTPTAAQIQTRIDRDMRKLDRLQREARVRRALRT
jgi:hypothetical protein